MSLSLPSRKKRSFWGDDSELPYLACFKKTRHVPPPNGFHLQDCGEHDLLATLQGRFPMLNEKTIATVLEKYGDNLEVAIAKLEQLQIAPQTPLQEPIPAEASHSNGGLAAAAIRMADDPLAPQWIDAILEELYKSENQADSRRRLDNMLRAFEQTVVAHYKENSEEMKVAQKQFDQMRKNNAVLCRALAQKQERLKAQDQEAAQLRQVLEQAQEKIRSLELSNYSLTMHLEKAIGPRVNDHGTPPDVF